jgi:hypothetical protein
MVIANLSSNPKIGVGVDPEIFVIDKLMGRYTSAHDLAPGTKDAPHPLKNGAVQVDGIALEYNTKPAYTSLEFAQYNSDVMKQLRAMLPEDRYAFAIEPAIFLDKIFFDSLPDGPKELGCMPDYNAYTGQQTPSPKPTGLYETMRTGSGHIHVSWTENQNTEDLSHRWDCNYVVKCLEYTVGAYMHLWDTDTHRANLYGKPGALRYRPYGVEWRSPSNAWLRHEKLWPWLFEAVSFVVKAALNGSFNGVNLDYYTTYRVNTRSTLNKEFGRILPGFPPMPDIGLDKKAVRKTQRVARISGTMRTTDLDINLDAHDGDVNILDEEAIILD